ncbi:AraC family transcriptional regulator [Paenibacillus dakarensis]|uniref:AraC family transcriptional regulator n=1 Tax=Paenibacillus dakarensis TaxID=1527293 RepID=UPI0006D5408C|nr:GyrI-like domain-containing protein [Paenibacillus dakarensis]
MNNYTDRINKVIEYIEENLSNKLSLERLWGKLGEWAGTHQLFPPAQYFIGISLVDPSTTEEHACRYDACVTLPENFNKLDEPETEIQYKKLPGGLYGLYSFYDTVDKLALTYHSVYGQWLPNSDYEPDDRHCLEFCMNNPADDPEGKAKVDLYIPIRQIKEFQ